MLPAAITIRPDRETLFGSSAAAADVAPVMHAMQTARRTDTLVRLDYSGVRAVNGSYLRGSLLWAIRCGQADVRNENVMSSGEVPPLQPYPLFPIFSNCSAEVAFEIAEFVGPRGLAALIIGDSGSNEIVNASIVGHLDKFLGDTLSILAATGGATAHKLSEASTEKITVNAWSNRLIDLYMMRLVHRERAGKFWVYKTIAKEHNLWASTL